MHPPLFLLCLLAALSREAGAIAAGADCGNVRSTCTTSYCKLKSGSAGEVCNVSVLNECICTALTSLGQSCKGLTAESGNNPCVQGAKCYNTSDGALNNHTEPGTCQLVACVFNDATNIAGCTRTNNICVTTKAARIIATKEEHDIHCLGAGTCTCESKETYKFLKETGCFASSDDKCKDTTNAPCTTIASGTSPPSAACTGATCACLVASTKLGCVQHSDCAASPAPAVAKCFSPGGVEIDSAETAAILCTQNDCVCKAHKTGLTYASGDNRFTGGACDATRSNADCFNSSTGACKDKNNGTADTASLKCRLNDNEIGCVTDDHCQSQLCLKLGIGRAAHGVGGGTCIATGADEERCAFHGDADKYTTGCTDTTSLCVTDQGVVLKDKAAYLQSRCVDSPLDCQCHDVSGAVQKTAGSWFLGTEHGGAVTTCLSDKVFNLKTLVVAASCPTGSAAGAVNKFHCICLVNNKKECTDSTQCLPSSTCYKHKKRVGTQIGICLDIEDNWNNMTLDEIETFDSTTLLDKLDSVETNLAAGTTAETTAVEAVVTAAQTVITNDVAKVKTDVKAMDAKVALESTAEKVKKDLDDTKDAVGDYGIAAVVLVAIMLVLGAVLSFSAAAKGAKRSSPSSSRVRGRQRYEESEGESST